MGLCISNPVSEPTAHSLPRRPAQQPHVERKVGRTCACGPRCPVPLIMCPRVSSRLAAARRMRRAESDGARQTSRARGLRAPSSGQRRPLARASRGRLQVRVFRVRRDGRRRRARGDRTPHRVRSSPSPSRGGGRHAKGVSGRGALDRERASARAAGAGATALGVLAKRRVRRPDGVVRGRHGGRDARGVGTVVERRRLVRGMR